MVAELIVIARLGPGAIFEEMSMEEEKPRSALCSIRVKCIRGSQFIDSFENDPDFVASLLKILLERLSETGTGARLAELGQVSSFGHCACSGP